MNEERKKILKMVEEGVISSEEASELFDSLDKAQQAKQANQLSKQVDWENGDSHNSKHHYNSKTSKKNSFFSLLEEAVTKIKNVDLDFNFGTFEKVSHIFHTQDAEFSKLDIDISNGSVTLLPWEESDVRIECEAKVYQVESLDEARRRFLMEAEYDITNDVMRLLIPSKQIKTDVQLRIPRQLYKKISLRLFNGPIDVKNVQVEHLNSKTTNGGIGMDQVSGKEMNVESANGTIKVEHCLFDDIDAETINGSIRLNGDFEKIDAQAVNGSIHCGWESARAHIGFFKTTTGSIRLSLPQTNRIDGSLITNMGSIHCNLEDYKVYEEKKEMIKKSLHFEANADMERSVHIEAETKTGSIWVLPTN